MSARWAVNERSFAPPFDRLASGSGNQLLECRAFQTVEVTFAGRRLLKDMLGHFKRRLPTFGLRSVGP